MIWQLFWTFFKIGAFTFGSGYAMISLIEREVVDHHRWFEREEFFDQFTLAQSAPGPFSLNTAVFVGYRVGGWWGALAAVIGLVLPSFVIILMIAMYLTGFRDNEVVNAAFKGIRPCVVALIAVPCVRMIQKLNVPQILLAVAAVAVIALLGVSPVLLLMLGALLGVVLVFVEKPASGKEDTGGDTDKSPRP
ncbi:MAG: chromate transporter [Bacteroidales bacterium]|nr:chromate transporter [Bacteroidales bacterium]